MLLQAGAGMHKGLGMDSIGWRCPTCRVCVSMELPACVSNLGSHLDSLWAGFQAAGTSRGSCVGCCVKVCRHRLLVCRGRKKPEGYQRWPAAGAAAAGCWSSIEACSPSLGKGSPAAADWAQACTGNSCCSAEIWRMPHVHTASQAWWVHAGTPLGPAAAALQSCMLSPGSSLTAPAACTPAVTAASP